MTTLEHCKKHPKVQAIAEARARRLMFVSGLKLRAEQCPRCKGWRLVVDRERKEESSGGEARQP